MAGSDDENPPPPPPPQQTPTQQAPHIVSTIKLPILKKWRERERKAWTTLLMALLEDHLAKFHKMTDAKEMWDAIKSKFGDNDESKKMQKYILKQQFEGFSVSNSEGLHKGYDMFQSLLSQLEIHGAGVSTEDANQNFLRSLPSSWSQVSLVMRTKPGVDKLKNVAFVSSKSTSSTNDVSIAYGVSTTSGYNSQMENSSSYTDEHMYSFFANQSSGPHLGHEDLEQLDEFDLEEMDLKWQVAMISMRLKKFYKKTGRRAVVYQKEIKKAEEEMQGTLDIEQKTMGGDLENRTNLKLCNSGSDTKVKSCSKECVESYAKLKKLYDEQSVETLESVPEPVVVKPKVVSQPKEQERPSFAFVNTVKHVKTPRETVKEQNTYSPSPKADKRDWNGLMSKKLGLGYGFTKKACFVCGSFSHLIRDCDFHEKRMAKQVELNKKKGKGTGQGRIEQQNLSSQAATTSTARKVNTARPIVNEIRPRNNFYKSHSPIRRPFNRTTTPKAKFSNQKVNTAEVKADETSGILKDFIRQIENQLNQKVKAIRCDNGTEFKNKDIIESCGSKGIKKEYINARTPQQNGVAERKNKTLIEAARTMLADSFLPNTFWAEAVILAMLCLNRVLVTKPLATKQDNPYENLITGKIPIISYIRPFGCHVTILNTIDHLGKFEEKSDEGFLVGYSLNSKAFRVYNLETKRVEENLHINFLENKPNVVGKGPNWLFDLDYLTDSMNYQPVRSENQANKTAGLEKANHSAGTQDNIDAGNSKMEADPAQDYFVLPIYSIYTSTVKSLEAKNEGEKPNKDTGLKTNEEPVDQEDQAFLEELERLKRQEKEANDATKVLRKEFAQSTEDLLLQVGAVRATSTNTVNTVSTPLSTAYPSNVFSTVVDFTNLESTVNVSPIPISRIQLLFNPDKQLKFCRCQNQAGCKQEQSEQKSGAHAFCKLYPKAEKKKITRISTLLVCMLPIPTLNPRRYLIEAIRVLGSQPPGFVDPKFPKKVYKVVKALYGSHQAPKAWYATLSTFLLTSRYRRGTNDKTLFIKKDKNDIMLVQVYVDDIIFGSTKRSWCDEFEALMKNRFQMSYMGELTFFLGLHVKQKEDSIFISQDKYVAEILKKFDFASVKTASTPIETQKPLTKDKEAADVEYLKVKPKLGLWYPRVSSFDLEAYSDSDYARANLDRKSTTGGCQFLGRRLISWQCKKQTIVATSTTKAEYVAAANYCGQVLWIQNQMLDYGFNFMNIKIYIDNESTICIVKNPVFHSKTKHIEIRHYFIRDTYEKMLIQVLLKIRTDDNVADLLTKAFDVSRFNFLIVNIRMINLELLWFRGGKMIVATTGTQVPTARHQELASPEQITSALAILGQMATGKESLNPLMADSLPKTIQSNDPPLSRGYTLRSGEDSLKLIELMAYCTNLCELVSKKNREIK
ncbi:putative ribonuclease H-like domain-containing protein [Tanacetum coccineum]|uniref:Ribonuclease H-like domain-containing protein n=1 Tax=Tanacetum coccineum TaxID=301880 RepID=A0ABQ5ED03_9ASTR